MTTTFGIALVIVFIIAATLVTILRDNIRRHDRMQKR